MSDSKTLKCQRCGKPTGYVAVAAKSFFVSAEALDNVKLVATCIECSGKTSLYRRNFLTYPLPFKRANSSIVEAE